VQPVISPHPLHTSCGYLKPRTNEQLLSPDMEEQRRGTNLPKRKAAGNLLARRFRHPHTRNSNGRCALHQLQPLYLSLPHLLSKGTTSKTSRSIERPQAPLNTGHVSLILPPSTKHHQPLFPYC